MSTLTLDRTHISDDALISLAENTNITHLAFGSKARVTLDLVNLKLEEQLQIFENNVDKAFLSKADGSLLDLKGDEQGIERPQAESASISSEEQNFRFYTLEPNFGSINNGSDIIVPKGKQVKNTSTSSLDNIVYVLIEDVVLPADETEIFFAARSLTKGEEVNVGENTLVFHDFTNYADILNNTLLVTNSSAISAGRSELDDESYRFLISQQPLAREKANATAIKVALLQIPGIASVTRIPYRRGIGTSDWIIKSVTPTVPAQLLSLAQSTIDEVASDGLDNKAVAPDIVGLQLFFSLTYIGRLENKEKTRIKEVVQDKLIAFVNNLDIGQKLVLDQLTNTILNASEKIESLGVANKDFDKLVIFLTSKITQSRIKKILLDDYVTRPEQRVIIEPGVETPISIFDNN